MKLSPTIASLAITAAASLVAVSSGHAATIAFQGFETAGDTWNYALSGGAVSNATGTGDTPANSRIFAGTQSLQVINTTSTATFDSVPTGGFSNVSSSFRLSSTSGTTGNGAEVGDTVRVFVALNGNAFGATPDITVTGFSGGNSRWNYAATGSATTSAGTSITVAAPASGTTAAGISLVTVNVPNGTMAVALKVVSLNNSADERWNLDSVSLTGDVLVTNTAPVILPVAPTVVTFGTVVSNGEPFSVAVNATDVNLSDALSLTVGTLPAGVHDIIVSGGGASPASFTITGVLDYQPFGTNLVVPFTVADGAGGVTPGSFTLTAVPEPTTLAALAGATTLVLRRRRA